MITIYRKVAMAIAVDH